MYVFSPSEITFHTVEQYALVSFNHLYFSMSVAFISLKNS